MQLDPVEQGAKGVREESFAEGEVAIRYDAFVIENATKDVGREAEEGRLRTERRSTRL